MTWLNYNLSPYTARLGIIPETQVATQPGVQTRDLMSFLSSLKTWSARSKTPIYLLKRDQMKGFDYLSPDGFYDACEAYRLPHAISELDRAAQTGVRCFPRTAFGIAEPIIVEGVTKQGGPLSPLKSTMTTSLGHNFLDDLASNDPDCITISSATHRSQDPHLPDDSRTLRFTMAEATDDSYIGALSYPALCRYTLQMERFQFVDDPTSRAVELKSVIDSFVFPTFSLRTPFSLVRKIISQNLISKCRALLSLQPISGTDASALDRMIAKRVHNTSGLPFCPDYTILTLPLKLGGLDFPSIYRINAGIAIDGLARDLKHHIPAYRTMARITLADWTCDINSCQNPLDGTGLQRSFSRYFGTVPSAWIIAHTHMAALPSKLSLRLTDQSHLAHGDCAISHALSLFKSSGNVFTDPTTLAPVISPNGHCLRSLRTMGFTRLSQIGCWTVNAEGLTVFSLNALPVGDWTPAQRRNWDLMTTAGILDNKSVTTALTGLTTLILKIPGRNISILQGEQMGIIAALILSDPTEPDTKLYTDHLNSVRLIADSDTTRDASISLRHMNGRSYYRWMVDLHRRSRAEIRYTKGHSDESSIASLLNRDADHYASRAQSHIHIIPLAPVPTFFMDTFTFFSPADGWIESNIRSYTELAAAQQTSRKLDFKPNFRMLRTPYDPTPPPDFPYLRALSGYSAMIQLYSRAGQLPTAARLLSRKMALSDTCRFGCSVSEDEHHIFVECPYFLIHRLEALDDIVERTAAKCQEMDEIIRRVPDVAQAIGSFTDRLDDTTPPNLRQRRFIHHIATDWHIHAIRLAGRIWGVVQRETAVAAGY
ncbi:hypothetical protein FPV67DRAFT_1562916 [Lyophyllum atratum]|nr:hypothetical protein FPV67DRAFT_1562916 [Lyophyllum atratum]